MKTKELKTTVTCDQCGKELHYGDPQLEIREGTLLTPMQNGIGTAFVWKDYDIFRIQEMVHDKPRCQILNLCIGCIVHFFQTKLPPQTL